MVSAEWTVSGLLLALTTVLFSCVSFVPEKQATPPPRIDHEAGRGLSRLEEDTLRAVNDVRAKAGLKRLIAASDLTSVARAHSADQARTGRSGHTGSDGRGPAERVAQRGIQYRMLAENVAMNRGYDDPVGRAVEAWMDSAGHRKNILEPSFEQTGVGVVVADDGAVYFTQLFLKPLDDPKP